MFKKSLLLSIIFLLIFSLGSYAYDYTYTQQSGAGYFVSPADKADSLEDNNELRTIVNDLGTLLGHSKIDGSYPKDLTTGGTLSIEAISLDLTGELDMTGAVIVDLNPNQVGTVQVINITPTAVISTNDTTWMGIKIDGNILDPSGTDISVYGICLDFSTFAPSGAGAATNHVDGLCITMPDITEHAIHVREGKIRITAEIPSTAIARFSSIDISYDIDAMVGTSGMHAIDVAVDEGEPAGEIVALATHTHVDVIQQLIGTFSTPDQIGADSFAGIEDGGVYTAGIDGKEMFVANDDGFWIGDVAKFDELEVDMSSDASKDVAPTFWYWKDLGTNAWVEFEPADDTEGFQHSGLIRFDSFDLTDWVSDDPAGALGATGYWIKVTRTAVADPGTPTALTIKINSLVLYSWNKVGDLVVKDIDATSLMLDTALAIAEGGTGVSTGAMVNFTSILNTGLYVGRDTDNRLNWATDDNLEIWIGGVEHDIVDIEIGGADNDSLVTQGYVDDVAAGGGADTDLGNLASVAINTSIFSDTQDTDSLGSATKEWLNLYIGDAGKAYFGLGQDTSIERSGAGILTLTAANGVITSAGLAIGGILDYNDQRAIEVKTIEFNGVYAIGVSGATKTVDWQDGAYQSITISEACVISFSNEYVGTLNLIVTYAGSFALTFGGMTLLEEGGVEIVTTDASGVDVLMFKNLGTADTYLMGALLDVKD